MGMLQKWGKRAVFIKATEIVPRVRNTTTTTYNNVDKYNPTPWVGSKLRKCEGGVGLSTRIKKKKITFLCKAWFAAPTTWFLCLAMNRGEHLLGSLKNQELTTTGQPQSSALRRAEIEGLNGRRSLLSELGSG